MDKDKTLKREDRYVVGYSGEGDVLYGRSGTMLSPYTLDKAKRKRDKFIVEPKIYELVPLL